MQKLRTIAKILFIVAVASFIASERAVAQSIVGPAIRSEVKEITPEVTYQFDQENPNLKPVVTALAFLRDEPSFIVGGDDHKVYVGETNPIDPDTNEVLEDAKLRRLDKFGALEDWIRAVAVNPDVNSNEIAALSQNGEVVIGDSNTGPSRKIVHKIKGAHSLDYSPNGKVLAVCGFDPIVYFYDAKTLGALTTWQAPGESSTSLKFSPNGSLLALGGRNGVIRVWNTGDGSVLKDFSLTNAATEASPNPKNQRARAVCFSPDGTLLAAAGEANQIIVWDLASGEQAASLDVTGRKIYSLVFSDDSTLVAGDSVNDVTVWSIPEQKMIAIGQGRKYGSKISNELGHTGTVSALIYDAKTKTLFSGSFDTTVIKWRLP